MNKFTKKRYMTRKRAWQIRKRKIITFLFFISLGSAVIGYFNTQLFHDLTVMADVPVAKAQEPRQLTLKEHVWKLLTEEGGLTFDEAIKGMAVVDCESSWDKNAEQYKRNTVGVDRGLWQINSHFHPEVTGACSYDVYCSTRAAIKIYRAWGNSWKAWTCS